MSSVELQQSLYWLADNMHIWVPSVVMLWWGVLVGSLHLIAIVTREGGSE